MKKAGQKHREKHRKPHPGSQNLRPAWKAGQSGNPGGRPKGTSLTAITRADGKTKIGDVPAYLVIAGPLGLTADDPIELLDVRSLRYHAYKGATGAISQLWDRIEGKIATPFEHSGPGESAIPVEVRLLGKMSDDDLLSLGRRVLLGDDPLG